MPNHRQDELEHQVSLLDREAKRLFRYPEELALAMVADSQGLGGIRARLPSQVKAFSPKSDLMCHFRTCAILSRVARLRGAYARTMR